MILAVDMSMMIHSFFHVRKVDDVYDVSERCLHKLEALRAWFLDESDFDGQFVAVFDNPTRELLRKGLFEGYKSGRTKHDDLPEIEASVLEAVSNDQDWKTIIARDGYEADDEIGSIAKQYQGKVVIHSADRDYHACLEDGRVVILKKANVNLESKALEMDWFTERDLYREYGILSDYWADFQILIGGKDSIPGWDGVGPKKATELIVNRCDVTTIDVNDPPVKLNKKQIETYESFRELYPKIKAVRTIKTDLPLPIGVN